MYMHHTESSSGEQSSTCPNDIQLSPSSLQFVVDSLCPLCSKLTYYGAECFRGLLVPVLQGPSSLIRLQVAVECSIFSEGPEAEWRDLAFFTSFFFCFPSSLLRVWMSLGWVRGPGLVPEALKDLRERWMWLCVWGVVIHTWSSGGTVAVMKR